MAPTPTEGKINKPERWWDCRLGTPGLLLDNLGYKAAKHDHYRKVQTFMKHIPWTYYTVDMYHVNNSLKYSKHTTASSV